VVEITLQHIHNSELYNELAEDEALLFPTLWGYFVTGWEKNQNGIIKNSITQNGIQCHIGLCT